MLTNALGPLRLGREAFLKNRSLADLTTTWKTGGSMVRRVVGGRSVIPLGGCRRPRGPTFMLEGASKLLVPDEGCDGPRNDQNRGARASALREVAR